jgi:hypothetical protein
MQVPSQSKSRCRAYGDSGGGIHILGTFRVRGDEERVSDFSVSQVHFKYYLSFQFTKLTRLLLETRLIREVEVTQSENLIDCI